VRSLNGQHGSGCSRSDPKGNDLVVERSWQRLDPFLPFLRLPAMCSMHPAGHSIRLATNWRV